MVYFVLPTEGDWVFPFVGPLEVETILSKQPETEFLVGLDSEFSITSHINNGIADANVAPATKYVCFSIQSNWMSSLRLRIDNVAADEATPQ